MIYIIDCGSEKVPHFEAWAKSRGVNSTLAWDKFSPENHPDAKAIIISGAPILLSQIDPTPYLRAFEWVKEIQIPVLGICFGHQIIGMHHGAEISMMPEDRDLREIKIIRQDPIFSNILSEAKMQEDHCEEITLPKNFTHIASSQKCLVEGMKHPSKPIWGFQFHPEVNSIDGIQLLNNFYDISISWK